MGVLLFFSPVVFLLFFRPGRLGLDSRHALEGLWVAAERLGCQLIVAGYKKLRFRHFRQALPCLRMPMLHRAIKHSRGPDLHFIPDQDSCR
jgi:hypothetical protein